MILKKATAILLAAAMISTLAVSSVSAAEKNQVTSGSYYNSSDSYATYSGDDLGATYTPSSTTFKVWAPNASNVVLNIYATGSDSEEGAADLGSYSMSKNSSNNVWSITVQGDLKNIYYTYSVTANGSTKETQDVYSTAVGVNGKRSMVVDLDSTDPDNWENDEHMLVDNQTDAVVWEIHVRDFSISDSSGVSDANQGKYLAFTEDGTKINGTDSLSTCVDYLVDQGVNYVHLNPVYDYGSVDETKLDTAQYNWGYDPVNYNVPEGSYSTNPYDGNVRINEFKQMVQALHSCGIGVIMDVVYNHTYNTTDSCFEKTVPGYYYRMSSDSTYYNGTGCGNVTASDKAMFRKYMIDSVKYWAEEYHIDGFRFDLMGCHDITTMNQIRAELDTIDSRILMYGEPWMADWNANGISTSDACIMDNASKVNSRIAMFNDRIRNGLKGGTDDATTGYIQGVTTVNDAIKAGMMGGSSTTFGKWALAPTQCVTYNSAHDNLTLWDKIMKSNGSTDYNGTNSTFLAQNKLSAAVILTSQGMPFYLAGEEFARTKLGDHNSYKSSDSINAIDWTRVKTYNNLVQYYKGLMAIRAAYSPFRAADTSAINTTYFVENGSALGYTIQNTSSNASKEWGTVAVLVNNNSSDKSLTLKMNGGTLPSSWVVVANGDKAGLEKLSTVSGSTVNVPARSAMVLVDASTFDRLVVDQPVYQTVTTKHVEKSTGTVLKTTTAQYEQGSVYKTSADSTLLEDYILLSTEGATSGTVGTSDITVTYYYQKDTTTSYTLTTKYVSQSGTELKTTVTQKMKMGMPYSSVPAVIEGYELDTTQLPVSAGTLTADTTVKYVYKAVESSDNVKVHYYNSQNWSKITMYAYDERTGTAKMLTGAWPGNEMTAEGDGWYVYPEISSDYAQVIFTNGSGTQIPGANQPGYEVSGEVWLKDGVQYFGSKVVVSHIDTNGKKLTDDVVINGTQKSESDTYTTSAISSLGTVVSTPDNATGNWSKNVTNVVYVYEAKEEPVTEPVTEPETEPSTGGSEIVAIIGDADGDGKISIADAVIIQRIVIGKSGVSKNYHTQDVNDDGSISVADAVLVMRYLIGSSSHGNVGETTIYYV
ncbi:MAG: type I pullulanase [Acutalibacteraceae bacterium]|nr:type I pullulanase [Acutalibacteraceae bacterium]